MLHARPPTPREALDLVFKGTLVLFSPFLMEELAFFSAITSLLEFCRSREVVVWKPSYHVCRVLTLQHK